MANYSLVLDTKFKPFSYQEMLAPVLAATTAHQAIEDELGNLSEKASVWDGMANEQTDPQTYRRYKAYAEDLAAKAEDLAQNGLNSTSRRGMLDMKSRYMKEIAPIEVAYKRREELAKEQRAAIANNPTLRYQRMANQMSLDDLIANPTLDYGQQYSGALLTSQVSQAAAHLSQVLNRENIGKLEKLGLPYQYQRMIQKGYSPSQVMAAMQQESATDPESARFLRGIVDQVIQSSGVADWADEATMKEFRAFANQGLYSAIGQSSLESFKDDFSMNDALDARRQARAAAAAKAAQQEQERRDNRLNPLALRSRAELDQANASINQWIKAGYFTKNKDGNYVMTEAGRKAYYAMQDVYETKMSGSGMNMTPVTYKTGKKIPSQFRTFMDKLGGSKYTGKNSKGEDSVQPGNMGSLFQKYIDNNKEGSYDTYHTTEYDRQLNESYGDSYLFQIKSAAKVVKGEKKIDVVEFKDGTWKSTKSMSVDDLKGYTVTNVRYSSKGNTAILQKKDGSGQPIRVKLPAGINVTAEGNVSAAIKNADSWGQILSKGKRPKLDANNNLLRDRSGNIIYTNDPLTDADRAIFIELQDEALSDMGSYGSQIVVPSKTKDEEYDPYKI